MLIVRPLFCRGWKLYDWIRCSKVTPEDLEVWAKGMA
jgi:hypothetical protein